MAGTWLCCHLFLSSSSSIGTPINKRPVLGYRNLNLFKLYRLVHKLGGFDNVSGSVYSCIWLQSHLSLSVFIDDIILLGQIESGSVWKQVYQDLGIPILNSAAGYNVKCAYRKYAYMKSSRFLKDLLKTF